MNNPFKKALEGLNLLNSSKPSLDLGKALGEGLSTGLRETKFDQSVEFAEEALKRNDEMDALRYSEESDKRYNTPKEKYQASEEEIDHVLATTPIYQRANERLNKAQRGQIGYGIDKYPNPLNADTWTIFETLDHMRDESIDKMHYEEMLREKFEQMMKELEELRIENTFLKGFKLGAEDELNYLKYWKIGAEKELEELRKSRIKDLYNPDKLAEATYDLSNGQLYTDSHIYPGMLSGSDHDGDVSTHCFIDGDKIIVSEQYSKSDVNYYKVDEDSTYIKNCKKATEAAEQIRQLSKAIINSLSKGAM